MDTIKASCTILNTLGSAVKAEKNCDGKGINHATWMLEGIAEGYIQYDKAQRWLGYAQGLLVSDGIMVLGEMKDINRKANEEK